MLKCSVCSEKFDESYKFWKCSVCGNPLTLEYKLKGLTLPEPRYYSGISVFRELLPIREVYSLGEGWTPTLEFRVEGLNVVFKLEGVNPTGSFKDRGGAVAVSKAVELGVKKVRVDSSGNAGVSISAYSSLAGIKAVVYVPRDAPEYKKKLIKSFGAEIVEVETRDLASKLVIEGLSKEEYYIGHLWNPYFIEGVKTIAYELYYKVREAPEYTFIPTSSGTLLLGLYRGIRDLESMGYTSELWKLIAVQAKGYSPLHRELTGEPVSKDKTRVADALRISNPPRLEEMVKVVRETRGLTCVPEDELIIEAHKLLARKGLLVEPTSAIGLAAAIKLRREGILKSGDRIVVVLTGTGIKTLDKTYWLYKSKP